MQSHIKRRIVGALVVMSVSATAVLGAVTYSGGDESVMFGRNSGVTDCSRHSYSHASNAWHKYRCYKWSGDNYTTHYEYKSHSFYHNNSYYTYDH